MIKCTNEADVVEAVRGAREPFEIVGAGTKRGFGRVPRGATLDLAGLSGIVSYEPDEMILTVRPGTKVPEIEAVLAEKNQCLGFDPPDWGPLFGAPANQGTIGGAIAANVAGSAAIRYGRARDHLLGFRAVNGLGEAYKGGGKVVKNVTGFDLSKLMCGSFGTLGPLTELTLRVFPEAPLSAVLAVTEVTAEAGLALLRRVRSSPLEATGLAYMPGEAVAIIRIDGAREPLAEKLVMLRDLLSGHEAYEVGGGDALFRELGGGAPFVDTALDVWRIAVPRAKAVELANEIAASLWYMDRAGGMIWAGTKDIDLHEPAAKHGGHAILLRARDGTRARIAPFAPEPPSRAALTRAVKAAFDPHCLFNPGRMWDGV
ncbi:MAG TPA: FAD-binding protein [Rhizomicrobium sp.]|jgi:glycolate oxidase FAD binding subunit